MKRILIVEDDIPLNDGIKFILQKRELVILQAYTTQEARKYFNSSIDLILLDVNLPDGSGLDLCHSIRQTSKVPIVFISANDTDIDIIKGLELGGDEYICKPFNLMVLRARVEALLRRFKNESNNEIFEIGNFYFDFEKMVFMNNDQTIFLSITEQKVLKLLIMNIGHIVTKEKILQYVWGSEDCFIENNTLVAVMRRLRNKLDCKHEEIKTVYGIGYKWKLEV